MAKDKSKSKIKKLLNRRTNEQSITEIAKLISLKIDSKR
jgi:hypothetical protein